MSEAEHINYIIARARNKAKASGEPLDNMHIAKHVRKEMNDSEEFYIGRLNRIKILYSEFLDYITESLAKIFAYLGLAFMIFVILVILLSVFNIESNGVRLVAAIIALTLTSLLAFNAQRGADNTKTATKKASHENTMSEWQHEKVLFEKALKKLDAD